MATIDSKLTPEASSLTENATVDDLANSDAKVVQHDGTRRPEPDDGKKSNHVHLPFTVYTRPELVHLYSSPLVKPPPNMPDLKEWFGLENEQNLNKKEELSTPSNARDRRFRRDLEDGETPVRPTFRSTLTQPSQMGNFKHQSLRANDRDRDRDRDKDPDKDRERDMRDKEGQERLRHLSDKYDRDRLALPANSNIRSKERDITPHLAASSSSRVITQGQTSITPARRIDAREAAKKKAGENEDWRKGAEPPRTGRDERSDTGRKDHDEPERPRSRVRDASKPRRDISSSRRDRDDKDKEREVRGDRDREVNRKERDELRRDRDRNRDGDHTMRREREDPRMRDRECEGDQNLELDDPRRWRDDGRRNERLGVRRVVDQDRDRAQERERGTQELGSLETDRRWTVVEERDGRKRSSGRDRRSGGVPEEKKDKDDRKEREREREREPAWMDTYIPQTPGAGIIGGQGDDGELDGIQAWKKVMKEKEQKDKSLPGNARDMTDTLSAQSSEKQLDEIQLFRLMMKREEEKKRTDKSSDDLAGLHSTEGAPVRIGKQQKSLLFPHSEITAANSANVSSDSHSDDEVRRLSVGPPTDVDSPSTAILDGRSLLSILTPFDDASMSPPGVIPSTFDVTPDRAKIPSSRLFPNPLPLESPPLGYETNDRPITNKVFTAPSAPTLFNPPQGSRLLAFGARNVLNPISNHSKSPAPGNPPDPQIPNGSQSQGYPHFTTTAFQNIGVSQLSDISAISAPKSDTRTPQPFTPFEDATRMHYGFEDSLEHGMFTHGSDQNRRVSSERLHLPQSSDVNAFSETNNGPTSDPFNPAGYTSGKGSRFAKFWDGKREGPVSIGKTQVPANFTSSPIPTQRQEQNVFNPMLGGNTDNRAMDDIFAMLNSSTQGQRGNPPNHAPPPSNLSFAPGQSNLYTLQQHQQLQLVSSGGRLDSLYDSRSDDRNFTPDGMVPGLRSAPPPRNREGSGLFSDSLDDPIHFHNQRVPQQQRGLDPMYVGPLSSIYSQQAGSGRNGGIPSQPHQYHGSSSPIPNQIPVQITQHQRLPPGLANLGGRPPHEPAQFLGMPGIPSTGLHSLHGNVPPQQAFNNFSAYNGSSQIRAPPSVPHQMSNHLVHNAMVGLGHPNMDMRGPNQGTLLGMTGGGVRGGFGSQQGPGGQIQAPHLLRQQQQQQQQQQHVLPHMVPHLLPPHLQQQGLGTNNQPAHDLMTLLMGGTHRE